MASRNANGGSASAGPRKPRRVERSQWFLNADRQEALERARGIAREHTETPAEARALLRLASRLALVQTCAREGVEEHNGHHGLLRALLDAFPGSSIEGG
jgi:hypothetical protein